MGVHERLATPGHTRNLHGGSTTVRRMLFAVLFIDKPGHGGGHGIDRAARNDRHRAAPRAKERGGGGRGGCDEVRGGGLGGGCFARSRLVGVRLAHPDFVWGAGAVLFSASPVRRGWTWICSISLARAAGAPVASRKKVAAGAACAGVPRLRSGVIRQFYPALAGSGGCRITPGAWMMVLSVRRGGK